MTPCFAPQNIFSSFPTPSLAAMTSPEFVTDIDGAKVRLGDTVRVLAVDSSIKLERNEVEKVKSMVGEEFEVDEIDEHGCAWVTKSWRNLRE